MRSAHDLSRRSFLTASTLAAGSLLAARETGAAPVPGSSPVKRPNILWISCEDISPRLGCYGDPLARTPNLDRFAREGMRCDRVFTSAPVCAPCRSGIITGMYQTTIGSHHMRTTQKGLDTPPYQCVPPPYVKAFTEYLRAAGYYCTNNAKTDYQFAAPVTAWDECSKKAHYKNRPDRDQPFFAVFNLTMTHESRTWQEPGTTDPAAVEVPPIYPDTPNVRKALARHYDNIALMDGRAGELLRELDDAGLADDTVVFFWSDHGDGLPRCKRWVYDSGTRVPMMVRWPGRIEPGSVEDDLISSIDFGPTVLSIAGVPIPAHMQGRAFLGEQAAPPREYVVSCRDRFDESHDMVRSVRDRRFRYIRNYFPEKPYVLWVDYRNRSGLMQDMLKLHAEGRLEGPPALWFLDSRPPEELYDCDADPWQIDDLAGDPARRGVLERMRGILDDWRRETGDLGDIPEANLVRRMWPDGVQPPTASPQFIPNAPGNRDTNPTPDGGVFDGPMLLRLYCPTHGASMAWTTEPGESPHWRLYTGPIRLPAGTTTIRAKAIRYGYGESPEVSAKFTVR